jgi:transcriptional regulator with PAS, ATPase and Fis domain
MNREEFKKEFGILGNTKEINDIVDVVMQVSKSDISILIYGESGTGKEVFAKAIHGFSERKNKLLVSVNCGAIPEGILESELFGHKRGSFTGAVESRKGYFEIADGGTLFLDEIAEMPLTTQVKLLRAIETQEFIKIGAETITKVDVRIIAATNKDLQREVDSGRFREDLFFRLKAVSLYLPPLRKRKSDIPVLVQHFTNSYSTDHKILSPEVTADAMDLLMSYPWPGNIRELKNTIESAIALNSNGKLDWRSFQSLIKKDEPESQNRNLPVYLRKTPEEVDRELLYRALFEIKKDLIDLKDLLYQRQYETFSSAKEEDKKEIVSLDQLEKDAITNTLEATGGNKRTAAKLLKISERTLYRKIKEYNI